MHTVLQLDYNLSIKKNNDSHHTKSFKEEQLILRRGEQFDLILHGKVPLDDNRCFLIAETGPAPTEESGTRVTIALQQVINETQWSTQPTYCSTTNTTTVSIRSSPNAPIGVYKLTLDQQDTKIPLGEFTLLFNAWCPKDTVYIPTEPERQEYILEKNGKIFKGTFKKISGTPWDFGQFEPDVLRICFKILDSSPKYLSNANEDCSSRKDPIYVSRVLSAMINSTNKRVLVRKRSNENLDGVTPTNWVDPSNWGGSAEILRRWDECGPVRFGNCWVFAAVACTVFRALGIPCRVVTTFDSTHDSNGNLTIDDIYRLGDEGICGGNSIRNFHVWVECWMNRPDLGSDFDGWQVCDPTQPQKSEAVFYRGPASVRAIKEGELTKKYDAPFIYAAVNADVVAWLYLPNGQKFKLLVDSCKVGRCISTKALGSTGKRCDITHEYKYTEGSQEERRVYEKAKHHNKLQQEGKQPGLNLKIKLAEDMVIGKDFEVCAVITNNFMDKKACKIMFMASAVDLNGKVGEYCAMTMVDVELPANEVRRVPLKLEYRCYASKITSERLIKLTALTMDGDYSQTAKTIVLDGPDIEIRMLAQARVNQPMAVELTMLNTLPEKLQDCSFIVQGADLIVDKIETRIKPLCPKEEAKARVEFTPTTAGTCMLVVRFKSDKLSNVNRSLNIDVKEPLPSEG
ncbi:protein-glutamine gamma-glutamyltransferase 2-like [Nelusetta ayraudi]|uniref:protein-glutamine gamma-glutamyltransferase 2-like n=1 Tax=Nelusetta ayraudi TaxID=303726 RepID=UPI003F6EA301